mmetsp:Transcript_8004/g.17812  ORF Transcript_8004/g.17812 Transcript_8004/m.17812 type:complete len:607 (-) Transcript_8004:26-1846(-)
MRDHFDPLAVVYQNQHHELERPFGHSRNSSTSSSGTMQDQGQKRRHFHSTSMPTQEHCKNNNGRYSPNNPFDAGFSQTRSASFSPASSNDAFAAVVAARVAPSQYLVATGPTTGAATTPTSTNVSSHRISSHYSNANTPGTKRNSNNDEFLDCNVLQSSLKRVRLSRCPGEFRLQSDLETLDSKLWSSRSYNNTSTGTAGAGACVRSNAINFSSTTWIHRSTGARLTMVDLLRICLFLPATMTASGDSNWNTKLNSNSSTNGVIVDPRPRAHPQNNKYCSYHRDYRWRIMIQIPRMYPHQPPVVTRIEGLSLDSIAINERPQQPRVHAHVHQDYQNHRSPNPDPTSSLFFTEDQVARSRLHSQSSGTMNTNTSTSTNATDDTGSTHHASTTATTVEWNNWSAVAGLGELLEFMVVAAASNTSTSAFPTTATTATTKSIFAMSVAARGSSSSSSSLSSVSSSSSSSCTDPPSSFWGRANTNNTNTRQHSNNNNAVASNPYSFFVGNNHVTNTAMMSEETATTSSNDTNVSGASFLLPNRFDVGYGRSCNGYEKYNQNPTSFAGANGNAGGGGGGGSTQQHNHRQRHHHQLQYREKQCDDDDVGMDMS